VDITASVDGQEVAAIKSTLYIQESMPNQKSASFEFKDPI
jgi:hypothetical protein